MEKLTVDFNQMGIHGHLLELVWRSIREYRSSRDAILFSYWTHFLVLCLFRRLHGVARSLTVRVLHRWLRVDLHCHPGRLLCVSSIFSFMVCGWNLMYQSFRSDRWDTAMAQKSHFKMQTQGITEFRKTFPQLPWNTVKNPTFIQTAHGCVDLPNTYIFIHILMTTFVM